MSGFSPARLLAPIALVLTALALIIVVSSGGDDSSSAGSGAEPTATATATAASTPEREKQAEEEPDTKTYTVESGDSPSSIAAEEGISVDELLEANPDADPNALGVGDELEIPAG